MKTKHVRIGLMLCHGTGATSMEPHNQPVCVVLTVAGIPEDEVRHYIDDAPPVLVLFRDQHEYISVLLACHPQVIVLIDADNELLQQSSQLIASLFSDAPPTVLSINVNEARAGSLRLVVHQLGTGATVCIGSLHDITLSRIAGYPGEADDH